MNVMFIFKLDFIGVQLELEGFRIFFILSFLIRILFKCTPSKEVIMLTFNDVKSRPLIANQSPKAIMSKILFGTSVKQGKLKV